MLFQCVTTFPLNSGLLIYSVFQKIWILENHHFLHLEYLKTLLLPIPGVVKAFAQLQRDPSRYVMFSQHHLQIPMLPGLSRPKHCTIFLRRSYTSCKQKITTILHKSQHFPEPSFYFLTQRCRYPAQTHMLRRSGVWELHRVLLFHPPKQQLFLEKVRSQTFLGPSHAYPANLYDMGLQSVRLFYFLSSLSQTYVDITLLSQPDARHSLAFLVNGQDGHGIQTVSSLVLHIWVSFTAWIVIWFLPIYRC